MLRERAPSAERGFGRATSKNGEKKSARKKKEKQKESKSKKRAKKENFLSSLVVALALTNFERPFTLRTRLG